MACEADVVLIDLAPNLGSINRAALVAAGHVITPLALGRPITLRAEAFQEWRADWQIRRERIGNGLPPGTMPNLGYVLCQSRLPKGLQIMMALKMGEDYQAHLAGPQEPLGRMSFYPSLMDMAREAGKPMFHLKPADGVLGSHQQAIRQAADEFRTLAQNIRSRARF